MGSTKTTKTKAAAAIEKLAAAKVAAVTALEQHGIEIAARIKIADEALVELKEKAGGAFKDFVNHRASIAKQLDDAKTKCKAAGWTFEKFRLKYAPNFSRRLTYELVAIGGGKLTFEDRTAAATKRQQEKRARDAVAKEPPPRSTGNTVQGDGVEAMKQAQGKPPVTVELVPPVTVEVLHPDNDNSITQEPVDVETEAAKLGRTYGSVKRSDKSRQELADSALHTFWAAKLSVPVAIMAVCDVFLKDDKASPYDLFKIMSEVLLPRMNVPTRAEARKLVTALSNKADQADRKEAA